MALRECYVRPTESVTECKYFSHILTPNSCFSFSSSFTVLSDTTDRSSVPEPNSAEKEKAAHVVQPGADLWAGEALSPAEVSGVCGARHARQGPEDDRRSGQNLVSEQKNKMEVSENIGFIFLTCPPVQSQSVKWILFWTKLIYAHILKWPSIRNVRTHPYCSLFILSRKKSFIVLLLIVFMYLWLVT